MAKHTLSFSFQKPYQRLTLQVVASGEFTEQLKNALMVINKQKYEERLEFIFCEHIEDSLSWMTQHGNKPDYIVVVVDPKIRTSCQIAEGNIKEIDPVYIQGGRLCLVNGSCNVKSSKMGVGRGHINVLAQKYSITLINGGDVLVPEKCLYLAHRILGLATTVCGYFSGTPLNLDIPGYDYIYS